MKFYKYQSLGNDFILIDLMEVSRVIPGLIWGPRQYVELSSALSHEHKPLVEKLCNRNFGVGADGVLFLLPYGNSGIKTKVMIFNADGSHGQFSVNGARCVARHLLVDGKRDCEFFVGDISVAGRLCKENPRSPNCCQEHQNCHPGPQECHTGFDPGFTRKHYFKDGQGPYCNHNICMDPSSEAGMIKRSLCGMTRERLSEVEQDWAGTENEAFCYISVKVPVNGVSCKKITMQTSKGSVEGFFVDVGNPHLILLKKFGEKDFFSLASELEKGDVQTGGSVNVSCFWQERTGQYKSLTYERGVGPTLSCGSAVVAFTKVLIEIGEAAIIDGVAVQMRGGKVIALVKKTGTIEVAADVDKVFDGEIRYF